MTTGAPKTALLLAGQGSERVGMGTDIAAGCSGCRDTLALADETLGLPLSDWMAYGPPELLRQTEVAQPALLAVGVAQGAHLRLLGLEPVALAGHSLGQYTALVLAGSLKLSDAVRLVAVRGRLMQRTVPAGKGAMAAVSGLSREEVQAVCDESGRLGVVGIACYNAPCRLVLSGASAAVAAAMDACWERGGGVTELAVSAPFHSELLRPMQEEFARKVAATLIVEPRIPVVDNVTGRPLTSATAVRTSLVRQVIAPVQFEKSLETLAGQGIEQFVSCGPGAANLKFASLTTPDIGRLTFEDVTAGSPARGGAHVRQVRR